MDTPEREKRAAAIIKKMKANHGTISHPKDNGTRLRRDRIRIEFPEAVDVCYVGENRGKFYITVTPRDPSDDDTRNLTTADLATLLGTTQERVRTVLRRLGHGVGSANRYDIAALQPDFAKIRKALDDFR